MTNVLIPLGQGDMVSTNNKTWTKGELLKLLEEVPDDAKIWTYMDGPLGIQWVEVVDVESMEEGGMGPATVGDVILTGFGL